MEEEIYICENCNAEIKESDTKCPFCGAKFEDENENKSNKKSNNIVKDNINNLSKTEKDEIFNTIQKYKLLAKNTRIGAIVVFVIFSIVSYIISLSITDEEFFIYWIISELILVIPFLSVYNFIPIGYEWRAYMLKINYLNYKKKNKNDN